uniref:Putative ovule protein n=1 Tax=Solanum chacoense TaxID=4108 RepID=A0A0V0H0W4_SOLCH
MIASILSKIKLNSQTTIQCQILIQLNLPIQFSSTSIMIVQKIDLLRERGKLVNFTKRLNVMITNS